MTDTIYDALRESHKVQRSLCKKLVRAADDSDKRQALFTELRIELAAHAAAEERFLYSPMLMDDMGLNSSRHALAEHHNLDECVEDIQKLSASSKKWGKLINKLTDDVLHHLKEEETKFFQISGKILTDSQKTQLAKRYQKDYQRMKQSLS